MSKRAAPTPHANPPTIGPKSIDEIKDAISPACQTPRGLGMGTAIHVIT
jgi:hypothetical protein